MARSIKNTQPFHHCLYLLEVPATCHFLLRHPRWSLPQSRLPQIRHVPVMSKRGRDGYIPGSPLSFASMTILTNDAAPALSEGQRSGARITDRTRYL